MPATIDNMLRWWGTEDADRPALSLAGDTVTYGGLDAWVGRVASCFAGAGLGVGERVSIYAENSLEWCVSALATIRAGAIVTGLHSKMVPAEVAYLLADYAPAIVLADVETTVRLGEIGNLTSKAGEPVGFPLLISIEAVRALRFGDASDVRRELDPDAAAVIITTSGSTARPKGVIQSHRSLIDYSCASVLEDPIDVAHPKMLIVPPLSTAGGCLQFMQIVIRGGTGYLVSKFDADEVLELIERERITIFLAVPIFFQRIAACPRFEAADVSCIKIAYTGGAAVPVNLLRVWAEKGVLVRQLYGQTECGGIGVVNPRRYALTHPDKCGYGGALKDVAIIDDAGRFLPPGQQGQIVLRGPGTMLGYWNNPEATAEALVDGWLRTGDLGVIDEIGLLKFVDRARDLIISGGLNISAAEVERVIMQYPGVEEVAVIAAADEKFGETPLAIIYPAAGTEISIAALIDHCNVSLSAYKVPRYVAVSEQPLPRLAMGKISKPELRQRYSASGNLPPRVR
jgi:acyl-CoA synthetase (AMP-forming)/AMP-acid ligase II